jgi:hypothetical protein
MTIKDDVLDALDSNEGKKIIEGVLLETLRSDEGQEALQKAIEGTLLETLQSNEGQKSLKKAVDGSVLGVLKSLDGQTALRTTVQAELEEGFASHAPTLTGEAKKKVGPNQQWLFDTIEKIRVKVHA